MLNVETCFGSISSSSASLPSANTKLRTYRLLLGPWTSTSNGASEFSALFCTSWTQFPSEKEKNEKCDLIVVQKLLVALTHFHHFCQNIHKCTHRHNKIRYNYTNHINSYNFRIQQRRAMDWPEHNAPQAQRWQSKTLELYSLSMCV